MATLAPPDRAQPSWTHDPVAQVGVAPERIKPRSAALHRASSFRPGGGAAQPAAAPHHPPPLRNLHGPTHPTRAHRPTNPTSPPGGDRHHPGTHGIVHNTKHHA